MQRGDAGAVYVVYGRGHAPETIELTEHYAQVIYGAYRNDFFGGMVLRSHALVPFLFDPSTYRRTLTSPFFAKFFSKSISAGDVNGDGVADLAVGAPGADGPRSVARKIRAAGAVYLFLSKNPTRVC